MITGGSSPKWCTMSIQHWQSVALNYSVIKSELHCYRFRNIWFSLYIKKISQVNVYLHLRIFSLASVTNKHRSEPVSTGALNNQFYSECIALVTKKWFSPWHWNPWVVTIMSTESTCALLPATGQMENITVLSLKQSAQMCKRKSLRAPLSSNDLCSAHVHQTISP